MYVKLSNNRNVLEKYQLSGCFESILTWNIANTKHRTAVFNICMDVPDGLNIISPKTIVTAVCEAHMTLNFAQTFIKPLHFAKILNFWICV